MDLFQFDIYAGNQFYSYGFAISMINRKIEEEWLYRIGDAEECIFLRSMDEAKESYIWQTELNFSSEKEKARFEIYAEDICNAKMNQTLFLSDIVLRSPEDVSIYQPFRDVMGWFERLTIIFPESRFDAIEQLIEDVNEKTRLETLLNYFDTGINGVEKRKLPFEKAFLEMPEPILESIKTDVTKRLQEGAKKAQVRGGNSRFELKYENGEIMAFRVVSNHGNEEELFEYTEESDGTQRLFDLIPLFQQVLVDSVIFIDELDRSLHTKAVQEFIRYFYTLAADCFSQLIVTTHDSNIMDLRTVRRDEIWFIERQKDHSSKLYSLNQFQQRWEDNIEKEYLLGRYGALPVFKQMALEGQKTEEGECYADTCQ